jgi:hypothetical protein
MAKQLDDNGHTAKTAGAVKRRTAVRAIHLNVRYMLPQLLDNLHVTLFAEMPPPRRQGPSLHILQKSSS